MDQLAYDLLAACLFLAFWSFFGLWGAGHYYARWQVDAGDEAPRLRAVHRRKALLAVLGGVLTLCCVIIDGVETAGWWWLRRTPAPGNGSGPRSGAGRERAAAR